MDIAGYDKYTPVRVSLGPPAKAPLLPGRPDGRDDKDQDGDGATADLAVSDPGTAQADQHDSNKEAGPAARNPKTIG